MNPSNVELLFAHDLMRFAMKEYNLQWTSAEYKRSTFGRTRRVFTIKMGEAVQHLSLLNLSYAHSQFLAFSESGFSSGRHFESYLKNWASILFLEGFTIWNFLEFCVSAVAMSVVFFTRGVSEAPDHAVAIIAQVLQDNKKELEAVGGWRAFYDECCRLLKKDLVVTYKYGSICRMSIFNPKHKWFESIFLSMIMFCRRFLGADK